MLLAGGRERLVRPLQDPLGADVDPASGRHLAEHRQAERLEPAELLPGRPARYEQRVRDQDPRSRRARAEDADRLAALDEQRLVLAEGEQRADERLQRLVAPGGLARAAVDDQLLRPLGDLAVEVVEQHAQRRLGRPRARVQLRASRRADGGEVAAERLDRGVERAGRAQGCFAASRSRARSRHHVYAVASTKAPPPPASDRAAPLPVSQAIATTIPPSTA